MRFLVLGLLACTLPANLLAEAKTNGIVFKCGSKEEADAAADKFSALMKKYGWTEYVKQASFNAGKSVEFHFDDDSTDSLNISDREELKIEREEVTITNSHTRRKETAKIASQKEIVAAMLTKGRAHEFKGFECSFDKFMDHVKIRQNIVKWNQAAYWKYPDGDEVFDRRFWTENIDLKPGVDVCDALAAVWNGQVSTETGCTNACGLIYLQGHFDYYKNEKPDRSALAQMRPLAGTNPIGAADDQFSINQEFVPPNNWVPGDWGYIKNKDAKSREVSGQEGSNIIYIGGGKFGAYYRTNRNMTLDQCIKRVYRWRDYDKREYQTEAFMEKLRQDPNETVDGMLRHVRGVPKLFGNGYEEPEPPPQLAAVEPTHRTSSQVDARPRGRTERPVAPARAQVHTPASVPAPVATDYDARAVEMDRAYLKRKGHDSSVIERVVQARYNDGFYTFDPRRRKSRATRDPSNPGLDEMIENNLELSVMLLNTRSASTSPRVGGYDYAAIAADEAYLRRKGHAESFIKALVNARAAEGEYTIRAGGQSGASRGSSLRNDVVEGLLDVHVAILREQNRKLSRGVPLSTTRYGSGRYHSTDTRPTRSQTPTYLVPGSREDFAPGPAGAMQRMNQIMGAFGS